MEFKMRTKLVVLAAIFCLARPLYADPMACNLSGFKPSPGLAATMEGNALSITWDGDKTDEMRLRLGINGGTPTIQDLSIRKKGGTWATIASNLTPEFRVVSGFRRLDQE